MEEYSILVTISILQLVEFSFPLKENKLISIFLSITFVPARFGLIWIWGKKIKFKGESFKKQTE